MTSLSGMKLRKPAVPPSAIHAVVFWHNAPPIHQYGLLRALAKLGRFDVVLVTSKDLLAHRRRMGWTEPDFGDVQRVHRPGAHAVEKLVSEHDTPHSLHIFSGIHAFPPVYKAFRAAIRTRARIGIIAIQPDPRGFGGFARRLMYRSHALRFGRDIDLFLALGEGGARWYRSVGFASDRVYAFGNFTEQPPRRSSAAPGRTGTFSMLFVGELLERKGVDVLLRALSGLDDRSWRLEFVGEGPVRERMQQLAHTLALESAVRWTPFQPHEKLFDTRASADLLVLPSAFDGWGVVVNEAMVAGVPVVCSDECGAADLVRASGRGAVFRAGDVEALRDVLAGQIRRGAQTPEERQQLSDWAACVSTDAGAGYLLSIFESAFGGKAAPVPPWTRTS